MRKLSGKTINSLALCVALAAPLVYLFGTLFMGLAGAHGNQIFAEQGEIKTLRINANTMNTGGYMNVGDGSIISNNVGIYSDYIEIEKSTTINVLGTWSNNAQCRIVTYTSTKAYDWGETFYIGQTENGTITLNRENASYMRVSLWPANTSAFEGFTYTTPPNALTYSNYLFGNFFVDNNFLAESGKEVLKGTPSYGFEPIGELVRYTDNNMLHLGNLSYGPLVIGYTYYCAHVIIVDLIFYIGSFIPRLIKKTINKLEGGLD